MRNGLNTPRSTLALLLCGLLLAASCIGDSNPAAAFGMFGRGGGGFGGGGFGRGGGGFGLRPGPPPGFGRMPPPHFGGPPVRVVPLVHPPVVGGPVGSGGSGNNNGGGNGGGGGGGGAAAAAQSSQPFVPDEVITAFAPGTTPQAINQVAARYGLSALETQNFALIGTSLYRWRITGGRSVASVIGALGSENAVASVQPNYIFTLQDETAKPSPTTQGDPAQYVLEKLQIAEAQKIATGKDVLVAVIDSAIDTKHPDLDGAVVKRFDAVTASPKPNGHGTAMAGAIASHGKLLGIAPGAQILAVQAFDDSPGTAKGTSFAIDKGVQWAADNGARIINMSFAGPADPMLQRLLAGAYDKGIVLIAAAGNAGPSSAPLYPAADPDVIAVTATDGDDHVFAGANRGRHIAVAAPGVDILVLMPDDKYEMSTGTSVAAAHVSGIAALLLERKPSLKPADIRAVLIATVKQLGPPKPDSEFGAGLVNAYRAVTSVDRKPAEPGSAAGDAQAKQ
jgi:subtilisin family serine protease